MTTILRSLRATAGFLERCDLEFSPGLNCIIGARGTCKSTLIESIRFAFDSDAAHIANITRSADRGAEDGATGLIPATLNAGCIRCEVDVLHDSDTTSHVLERELGSPTRLFQDGVREHASRDILDSIEIFSQGDLQRIADDEHDNLRLSLIDRPNSRRVAELTSERLKLTDDLSRVGPDLRTLRSAISALRLELQPLVALQADFAATSAAAPPLSPELERERQLFERRRGVIDSIASIGAAIQQLIPALEPLDEALEATDQIHSRLTDVALAGASPALEFVTSVRRCLAAIQSARNDLLALNGSDVRRVLERRFEHDNSRFYQLRQEQQTVNESLKRQQHLARQIEILEKKRGQLDKLLADEQSLTANRAAMRAKIAKIDDELYDLRLREIDAINREHQQTVQLTLRTGSGARNYVRRLSELLTGSRLKGQEDVAAAIADSFTASALIDIVESGDGRTLSDVLARDLGQMNRVVAHLGDHAQLYSLETEPPNVQLEITLYDNGQPKRVESLSKGQRATALLPLILRPLPYPLLFDQPEDDLDNNFIFKSLIRTVQSLRVKRQLIFVTHNANIPVLGGADRVIVMQMASPTQADKPKTGTVDERKQDVLDLLEGGADAFRLREKSYHELLESHVASRDDRSRTLDAASVSDASDNKAAP